MYAYYFGLSGKSSSYDALWCRCSMMSKAVSMTVHTFPVRAIPFEYTWGGWNAHLLKNHGGRGSR